MNEEQRNEIRKAVSAAFDTGYYSGQVELTYEGAWGRPREPEKIKSEREAVIDLTMTAISLILDR